LMEVMLMEFRRPYPNSGVEVPAIGATYMVYGVDSNGDGIAETIYAKNGKTGEIEFSGDDAGEIINKIYEVIKDVGGVIVGDLSTKLPTKTTINISEFSIAGANNRIILANLKLTKANGLSDSFIKIYHSFNVELDNIIIDGVDQTVSGIHIEDTYLTYIRGAQIKNTLFGIVATTNTSINTTLFIEDTHIYNTAKNGIHLYSIYLVGIKNTTVESISTSYTNAIYVAGWNVGLENVYIESTYYGINLYAGHNVTLDNVYIYNTTNYGIIEGQYADHVNYQNVYLNNSTISLNPSTSRSWGSINLNGKMGKNAGIVTFTGDGTTTTFSVATGLVATPSKYWMIPLDENAKGYSSITASGAYLVVAFPTALPSGSTATFSWYAEV